MIGAVERTPERRIFAVSVTGRDKDLIKTVILDHIEPGSIIYSDGLLIQLQSQNSMKKQI